MQNQSCIIGVEECEIPVPPPCSSSWQSPEAQHSRKKRTDGSIQL
jgi:hypothetical protein